MGLLQRTKGDNSMTTHSHFPLFLRCENKKVLVVGGGNVATKRITRLLSFPFQVQVVTLTATPLLLEYAKQEKIMLELRQVTQEDFKNIALLFMCTDQAKVNEKWGAFAKAQGILVNQCHNKDYCDFYFPALITHEELLVAVTGDGTNHKKVANMRNQINDYLESTLL